MDTNHENEVTSTEESTFYAFIPLITCVLAYNDLQQDQRLARLFRECHSIASNSGAMASFYDRTLHNSAVKGIGLQGDIPQREIKFAFSYTRQLKLAYECFRIRNPDHPNAYH